MAPPQGEGWREFVKYIQYINNPSYESLLGLYIVRLKGSCSKRVTTAAVRNWDCWFGGRFFWYTLEGRQIWLEHENGRRAAIAHLNDFNAGRKRLGLLFEEELEQRAELWEEEWEKKRAAAQVEAGDILTRKCRCGRVPQSSGSTCRAIKFITLSPGSPGEANLHTVKFEKKSSGSSGRSSGGGQILRRAEEIMKADDLLLSDWRVTLRCIDFPDASYAVRYVSSVLSGQVPSMTSELVVKGSTAISTNYSTAACFAATMASLCGFQMRQDTVMYGNYNWGDGALFSDDEAGLNDFLNVAFSSDGTTGRGLVIKTVYLPSVDTTAFLSWQHELGNTPRAVPLTVILVNSVFDIVSDLLHHLGPRKRSADEGVNITLLECGRQSPFQDDYDPTRILHMNPLEVATYPDGRELGLIATEQLKVNYGPQGRDTSVYLGHHGHDTRQSVEDAHKAVVTDWLTMANVVSWPDTRMAVRYILSVTKGPVFSIRGVSGGDTDGPSSGAIFATSYMLTLLDEAFPEDVAMTGAIDNRMNIIAVGGLANKLDAAYYMDNGDHQMPIISLVYIPAENKEDFEGWQRQNRRKRRFPLEVVMVCTLGDLLSDLLVHMYGQPGVKEEDEEEGVKGRDEGEGEEEGDDDDDDDDGEENEDSVRSRGVKRGRSRSPSPRAHKR